MKNSTSLRFLPHSKVTEMCHIENAATETVINFFEGTYLFFTVETKLNVRPDYIEYKLANQYEYRPTTETLWATVTQGGVEVSRYIFKYGQGLTKA